MSGRSHAAAPTPSAAAGALEDLPPLRAAGRLARLRERLEEAGVDAAVFFEPANVRWLTGFTGSNGTVVVRRSGEALLLTDGRYSEQAPAQLAAAGCSGDVDVAVARRTVDAAKPWLQGAARLGLEDTVSWGEQIRWNEAVAAETVPLSGIVESLRAVKDGAELARIEAAASIADTALASVVPMLRPGTTESHLQQALDGAIRSAGAPGPAYDTIVASGPNAALPHATPTDRRLESGDLVIIDVGALVDGYRSDMTRTFVLGDPSDRAAAMLEAVERSQAAGAAAVAPGVEAGEIDKACRAVIDDAGMGDAFVHGTGHGVGLDIHELPRVASGSAATLEPGNVLTVEPGVYFPGFGGVRVEDLLVVTDSGCRPLTLHPKTSLVPLPA
ncbi:MAG: Xaa-Pro peptidase family protein [Acidimicrobiaceae bacterium]|nr:Xaa-Pro peptidase family protein [Acidimicrobiaceae bacterium]